MAVTPQWSTGANTLGVDSVMNLPGAGVAEEEDGSSNRFHHSAMRPPPEALSAPLNVHVNHDLLICGAFT